MSHNLNVWCVISLTFDLKTISLRFTPK